MTIVTTQDLKHDRLCRSGARYFFHRYSLDWTAFVKHGIEAETLLATGDALAITLVENAEARRGQR